jgi:predicted AlkP superfamily phosphohydrolase/phosphomutase
MSPRGEMVDAPLVPASRTVDTIWTILSSEGVSCGVLGWPGTWPAEQLDGVVVVPQTTYVLEREHNGAIDQLVYPVSEFEAVDALMIRPESVTRRDLSRFVNMRSTLGLESLIGQNYEALAASYAADKSMADVASLVTAEPGVKSVFVCLTGADAVSQRFWHYMDTRAIERLDANEDEKRLLDEQVEALGGTIDSYYEFLDQLVGELVALAAEDATIAIVSDHGYSGVSFDENGMPKVGTFMHSERGMWILRGPSVTVGARDDKENILDVAPTIMAAASIPAPAGLDGRVATALVAH